MNLRNRSTYRAVAGLALLSWSAGASASVLAYEGFAYPAGMTLPGMPLGTGWGAPWVGSSQMVATPPTLNYPLALPPMGIALANTAVGEAFRPFVAPINNTLNDVWISFMEETAAAAGGAFVSLFPSGSTPTIDVNKASGGSVSLVVGSFSVGAGFSKGPGQVDFFVLHLTRFSGGVTQVELYLNPTSALVPPASATLIVPSVISFGQFYYRSDPNQWLDEIRVGTLPGDVAAGAGSTCYANCDGSTTHPCLTVADFSCYLNRYAAGDAYANCDGSTTPPVLTVADFSCFLNKYAAGCSGC